MAADGNLDPGHQGVTANQEKMDQFVKLFATHQRTVYLYLRSMLPTQNDVDDVFQETSLTLWREFHRYQLGTNFGAWACTIAFNRVRAWRTKRSRETLVFSEAFLSTVSDELIDRSDYYEERVDALNRCVEKLPPHHRELLRHRYRDQRPVDVIAEQVQRSTDAVYRMLSRVR
ncbi:MAG: sigma-70 family RNA polymerase sigma factor, partial [Pirellulales bacterium]|nr:sigma-70 family RNA polymerase sigma factor [Pirellulales bacterium]